MGAGTSPASSQKPVIPLFLYHSEGFKSEYRKQHLPYSEMSSQRWPLAKSWTRLMKQEGSWVPGFRSSVASLLRTRKAILRLSGSIKSIPEVRGILATLEVVGVKVLSELGKY